MGEKISRRRFFDYLLRIGICVGFGYPIVIEPNWLAIEHVDVPISDLPIDLDGLKIGFIADLHRGRFVTEGDISKAVHVLQNLSPDIILLGGDFVKGKAKYIDSCAENLSKLKAPLGVYAVLGNHEYWTNPTLITSSLQKQKIKVLINESVKLTWQGSHFYLVGLDDAWEGEPQPRKALKGTSDDIVKILLVHEPDYADRIKNVDSWIPLQLSGHSHGGQVSLPFTGPLYYPYLAEKYPMGLNRVSGLDRWVYTTRGIGITVPLRFNCRPEISILTLRSA